MRKTVVLTLVLMLVLPAFLQVMPHGVDHALQRAKATHLDHHHRSDSVFPGHESHGSHEHAAHQSDHPFINLDVVTFYKDYLHVDLKAPEPASLEASQRDHHKITFPAAFAVATLPSLAASFARSRAPPQWRSPKREHLPLFLLTQRIRI